VTLRLNGETKQDANTSDMIFPVAEIVAQLSVGMTLLPGTHRDRHPGRCGSCPYPT
jgi:2-keto-4-pentenoate hydratase/2-oxohepta-3-ene-1,7-dioic acid hydratase in catechol pathway